MTQIATVEKILPGGMAEISVPRKSACGHDCEECAGCGVSGAGAPVSAFFLSPLAVFLLGAACAVIALWLFGLL